MVPLDVLLYFCLSYMKLFLVMIKRGWIFKYYVAFHDKYTTVNIWTSLLLLDFFETMENIELKSPQQPLLDGRQEDLGNIYDEPYVISTNRIFSHQHELHLRHASMYCMTAFLFCWNYWNALWLFFFFFFNPQMSTLLILYILTLMAPTHLSMNILVFMYICICVYICVCVQLFCLYNAVTFCLSLFFRLSLLF